MVQKQKILRKMMPNVMSYVVGFTVTSDSEPTDAESKMSSLTFH
jgi:hypothetical protein